MSMILLAAAPFELEEDLHSSLYCIGIGPVRSAMESSLIADLSSKDVLFVGSCGVFDSFTSPTLYGIREVCWSDLGMRLGLSYSVAMPDLKLDPPQDLPSKIALCSGSVAQDNRLSQGAKPQDYVENLELYSVATAILAKAKSFQAILCSTNLIGPNSHQQWKANHQKAAKICSDYIRRKII